MMRLLKPGVVGAIKWKLLFVFMVLSLTVFTQSRFSIKGIITDEFTQLPIESVNIQLDGSGQGCSTNSDGFFELKVNRLPTTLKISHIAYFDISISIPQEQSDTLMIVLSPKNIILDEAEILSGEYSVFQGQHQDIMDYSFMGSRLIILIHNYSKKQYELVLTNEVFDTLCVYPISAIRKPDQLFSDCLGNCHLLTRDSAYQIYIEQQKMALVYPAPLQSFLNTLGDCLFETSDYLAFRGFTDESVKLEYASRDMMDVPIKKSKNEKWKHLFYFINKKSHKKTVLDQVYEWEKNRDAYDQAVFVFNDPYNRLFFGEILRFKEMTSFKPAFQSLELINDTIYYFNHLQSKIDVYTTDLEFVKAYSVDYQNQNNWKPILLIDHIQNRVFTLFGDKHKKTLCEIDLLSGTYNEIESINKPFPKKIAINNGYLYFLYKDQSQSRGKNVLFMKDLEE